MDLKLNCTASPCNVGADEDQENGVFAAGVAIKALLNALESVKFVPSATLHVDADVQLPLDVDNK
jgi:hypothetical protein